MMKNNLKKYNLVDLLYSVSVITFFTLFSFFVFLDSKVFAQEFSTQISPVDLTVSPPVSYLKIKPASTARHTIVLENNGNSFLSIKPKLVDFETDGTSNKAIPTNQLTFPYVDLEKITKEIELAPKQKAQLVLEFNIPANAPEKEYALSIIFIANTSNEDFSLTKSGASLEAGIASNLVVLVSKENKLQKQFKILDFQSPTFFDSLSSLKLKPIVLNQSISGTQVNADIKIINFSQKVLRVINVHQDMILGGKSRELRGYQLQDDEQIRIENLEYKQSFFFGPYKILITFYDENGEIISQEYKIVYAVPFAVILVVLSFIFLSVFYYKKLRVL